MAGSKSFCRIRLNFLDTDHNIKQSYWHLIDYENNNKICDIQKRISECFLQGENIPSLLLDDALLPPWEKAILLRDGDTVTVLSDIADDELKCGQDKASTLDSGRRPEFTFCDVPTGCEQHENQKKHHKKTHKKEKKNCYSSDKITFNTPYIVECSDVKEHRNQKTGVECDGGTNAFSAIPEYKEISVRDIQEDTCTVTSTPSGAQSEKQYSDKQSYSRKKEKKKSHSKEANMHFVSNTVKNIPAPENIARNTEKKFNNNTDVVTALSGYNQTLIDSSLEKNSAQHNENHLNCLVSKKRKSDCDNNCQEVERSVCDSNISNNSFEVISMTDTNKNSEKRRKRKRHKRKSHGTTLNISSNKMVNTWNKTGILFPAKLKPGDSNKHLKFQSDSSNEETMPFIQSIPISICKKTLSDKDMLNNVQMPDAENTGLEKSHGEDVFISSTDLSERNNSIADEYILPNVGICADHDSSIVEDCHETNLTNSATYPAESPGILPSSKLPNGVTVFSRPRQKQKKKLWELSKNQQLNTVATNKSMILQNSQACQNKDASQVRPCEEDPTDAMIQVSPLFKDYTRFPLLHGAPRAGDKIAYKILEVSENYTPEISSFKEAVVTRYDPITQNIDLTNLHIESDAAASGKFAVIVSDDEEILTNLSHMEVKVTLSLKSLLEPRLIS